MNTLQFLEAISRSRYINFTLFIKFTEGLCSGIKIIKYPNLRHKTVYNSIKCLGWNKMARFFLLIFEWRSTYYLYLILKFKYLILIFTKVTIWKFVFSLGSLNCLQTIRDRKSGIPQKNVSFRFSNFKLWLVIYACLLILKFKGRSRTPLYTYVHSLDLWPVSNEP